MQDSLVSVSPVNRIDSSSRVSEAFEDEPVDPFVEFLNVKAAGGGFDGPIKNARLDFEAAFNAGQMELSSYRLKEMSKLATQAEVQTNVIRAFFTTVISTIKKLVFAA